MENKFDIIVIGAGSGGLTVAIGLAKAGKKVALVEKGLIGGDCTNFGCVPSKAFLDIARSGKIQGIKNILEEVRKRRKYIQDEESVEHIEKYGIQVFQGEAKFIGLNEISISGKKKIEGKKIVIATGSSPQIIPIQGISREEILTNKNIFELNEDISSIAIIGGGYIGCEMAEAFSLSGVKVTLLQRNTFLIPREEVEASEFMYQYLQKIGVDIYVNSQVVELKEGCKLVFQIQEGRGKNINYVNKEVYIDKVCIALGRYPNTDKIGLGEIGIKYDEKGIQVDRFGRTNKKHIYAIGDVVYNNLQFTHLANHDGRKVIKNVLLSNILISRHTPVIPSCLYTTYEVSRIGKTEKELLSILDISKFKTYVYYFSNNDRGKVTDDLEGFIKIHFTQLTGKILGATIVGKHAGEMINTLTLAMEKNISAYTLSNMMFPYPTKSEVIKKVSDAFVVDVVKNIRLEILLFGRNHLFKFIPLLFWILLLVVFLYVKYLYGYTYETLAIALYNTIQKSGFLGILLFILVYALRPIILFPASFMTFMSGAVWGPLFGMLYTIIGSNLGGQVGYFMAGYFGKSFIQDDDSRVDDTYWKKAKSSPFLSVIAGRLLFIPYDMVSFGAGFFKLKWSSFSLATFLGTLPGSLSFVLAGAAFYGTSITSFSDAFKSIDTTLLYFAAGIFIISIGISKIIKKYFTT